MSTRFRWPVPGETPAQLRDVTQSEVVEAMFASPSTRHDQLKGDLLWVVWAATDAARLIVVVLVREHRDSVWRIYAARPMTDPERDYWVKETS